MINGRADKNSFKFQHACGNNKCMNVLHSEDLVRYEARHVRVETYTMDEGNKKDYIHEGYNFYFLCTKCENETVVRKFELNPEEGHESLVRAFHSKRRRLEREAGKDVIDGFVEFGGIALPEKSGGCTPFVKDPEEKGKVSYADPKFSIVTNPRCSNYGHPQLIIEWGVNGRGFGSYTFVQEEDHLRCYNECDSKKNILKVLEHVIENTTLNSSWDD